MSSQRHFDCLVVGGGLIGMLTARELAQAGLSIGLVERGETGRESTWAGGGILSPLYPWRYPAAVSALASWSQARYPALAEALQAESGIDPEYQHNGLLILDTEEAEQAQRWATQWQHSLELVNAGQIRELEPALGDVPARAVWIPEVGQMRNPRLAQALRKSIENQAVHLFEHTLVKGLLLGEHAVHGLMTEQGEFKADRVVIAGGAWSARLLESTGVELPVRPVRGQMILYRAEPNIVQRIVLSRDRYVIPRRDGRILVGSTLEEVGFDKSTTRAAMQELEGEACRLIPALAGYEIEHHWAGLRPGSPHGIPYIMQHPRIEGLFINTGHFRNGVVLGLASARLLADILLERQPILEPAPYAG
ncbi:MAG: glycine oxidase ThiO [Gammaproteobacteria bacterium]|nr:glycine oxidase ThiO [Gammaproteobacteria bacterium]